MLLTARTASQRRAPRHLTTFKLILWNILHYQRGCVGEYVKSYLALCERGVKFELLLLLGVCLGN